MQLMHQQLHVLYIITVNFNLDTLYVHYFAHIVFQSQLKCVSFTTVESRKYDSLSYYVIFCKGLGQLSLDLFLSFHIVAQTTIYAVFCL